jgi:hypothetical protein
MVTTGELEDFEIRREIFRSVEIKTIFPELRDTCKILPQRPRISPKPPCYHSVIINKGVCKHMLTC